MSEEDELSASAPEYVPKKIESVQMSDDNWGDKDGSPNWGKEWMSKKPMTEDSDNSEEIDEDSAMEKLPKGLLSEGGKRRRKTRGGKRTYKKKRRNSKRKKNSRKKRRSFRK